MAVNDDSILDSIKKLLNIPAEDTDFDTDIILHINSALGTLHQLGVGPTDGFMIEDNVPKWHQFIGDVRYIQSVKTAVYYEVRLAFDPPQTSYGITAFQGQLEQLKWRLTIAVDRGFLHEESLNTDGTPVVDPFGG